MKMEENIGEIFEVEEGERFYLRISKSGKGVYATNETATFGLRGNLEHLRGLLSGEKEFVVLEVRVKETQK